MHQKGLTPMSLIWVVVLVGVLFIVGRTVTPPPPGPPVPPPKAKPPVGSNTSPNPGEMKSKMLAMRDQKMKQMKQGAKPIVSHIKTPSGKPFDPNSIDVTPTYFNTYQEGRSGEEAMDKRVAAAKADLAAQQAARKAAQAAAHPGAAPGAGGAAAAPAAAK